eukprot:6208286-Pleurochrysis_carterae.AAC.3
MADTQTQIAVLRAISEHCGPLTLPPTQLLLPHLAQRSAHTVSFGPRRSLRARARQMAPEWTSVSRAFVNCLTLTTVDPPLAVAAAADWAGAGRTLSVCPTVGGSAGLRSCPKPSFPLFAVTDAVARPLEMVAASPCGNAEAFGLEPRAFTSLLY